MGVRQHFGIDFGTTNSSVVQCIEHEGIFRLIPHGDDEGRPMPSIVAIDKDTGEVHTGREAWNKRIELSQSCECIQSVKSLLAKDEWQKYIAGKLWKAEDVTAEVFKALSANVKLDLDGIHNATVAVPIGFSRKKRESIRKAAEAAGIYIENFVSEPTAAFFANYEELKSYELVVIFDWGGGTLDVSVIRNSGGRIFELAAAGMDIAGDDIDLKLAEKLHSKIARKKEKSISFDEMSANARDMLIVKSERAKRALSDEDDVVVSLNRYGDLGAFRENVSYEWFEAIVEGIVDKAIACLDKAISESGETDETIDRVVMVGGTSNIGPLLERMDERFGDKLFFPEETVWSIGKGAARLSRNPGSYHSAQDVGIILSDGSYFPLLQKGDSILGWSRKAVFALTDMSEEIRVVFSGSKDIDEEGDRYRVIEVPSYKFLEEKIELRAFIDENCVFRVEMKSSMRRKSDARVWEYDKLKLYYSLEDCGL